VITYIEAGFYFVIAINILLSSNTFNLPKYLKNIIIIFIGLMLLSSFKSTDWWYTFKNVFKFSTLLLLFIASIKYFYYKPEKLKVFLRNSFIAVLIYGINISVCSIFHLGTIASYLEKSSYIYLGQLSFYELYPLVYLPIFLAYNYIYQNNKTRFVFVLVVFSFILLLIFKRAYVYNLLIALVVVFVYYYRNLKTVLQFGIVVLPIVFIFSFSDYASNAIKSIIQVRSQYGRSTTEILTRNPLEEGRFLEYTVWVEEMYNKASTYEIMFGKELFNSQGKFFHFTSLDFSDRDERVLHSDLAHVLFGMGIVGTIVFILLHIYILHFFNKIKDKKFKLNNSRALQAILYGIFISLLMNIFEDGILGFPNRLYPFLFLGCILGLISYNKSYLEKTHNNSY
jgi:hypothetical protein